MNKDAKFSLLYQTIDLRDEVSGVLADGNITLSKHMGIRNMSASCTEGGGVFA